MIIPPMQVAERVTTSKREAILDAALELFEERTYAGCAMPLVAEAAGVGAGTIYRYFTSKEALANALYQKWKTAMADSLFGEPAPVEPRAAFTELWGRLFVFASEHPRALAFLETHKHAPYLDQESAAAAAAVDARAAVFVERLQRSGAIRLAPAEELIALVFGAFIGLVKAIDAGALSSDTALIGRTEQAVWQMLTAGKD